MPQRLMPSRIRRRNPTLLAVMLGLLLPAAFGMVRAQDCDCSCSAYQAFRAEMESLRGQGGGASRKAMSTMSAMTACNAECQQDWAQCAAATRDQSRQAAAQQRHADRESAFLARLGAPRDDLSRFHGEYEADRGLVYLVVPLQMPQMHQDKPGYLMVSYNKAGPAPMYLKSVGDARFEAKTSSGTAIVAFELGHGDHATALILTNSLVDGERYPRIGGSGVGASSSDAGRSGMEKVSRAAGKAVDKVFGIFD